MAITIVVPVLFATILGGFLWINAEQRKADSTETPIGQRDGATFELVDQQGILRESTEFRGRWTLVTFGYTYCPDICPTTLSTVSLALDILARRQIQTAKDVVPVFVTIDPERDTVQALADYSSHFHPNLVMLTGSPAQVAKAAELFDVRYRKVEGSGSQDYLMDHTAYFYLVGPDGDQVARFQHTITPEKLAGALTKLTAP
jgi:protein SCO1/2